MTEKDLLKQNLLSSMEKFKRAEPVSNTVTNRDKEPPAKKCALDILLGPDSTSTCLSSSDELSQYFTEPTIARTQSPLSWWKDNHRRFAETARVARAYLSIPATSTPSERVFSTAGLTVTKLRSCLKPKNVNCLIFLNKNSKHL